MRTTKKHRRIYEDHRNIRLPSNIEIHHIDGNHNNNDISNLLAVTLEEHYKIHYAQGDWAACLLISGRHAVPPGERRRLASLAASKANAEGKCGFKLGHASKAGKIGGKKGGQWAKENRAGIFALTQEQITAKNQKAAITKLINNGKACAWPKKEI